jgi:hypothetical protein
MHHAKRVLSLIGGRGMGSFYSKLAGVSHPNDDGTSRQNYIRKFCKPGMRLVVVREPANPYDPNAIAVFVEVSSLLFLRTRYQIGYLKNYDGGGRDKPGELARHIDNGGRLEVTIADVTGGTKDKAALGVNVLIEKL